MQPNKKKALIKILKQLKPYRELAEGFMILVKESKDDNLADELLNIIYDQVKKIQQNEKKEQIYNQLKMLKKHNKASELDKKEADALLDALLAMLEER